MPYGEKSILRAFVLTEMEKAKEEQEEYEKAQKKLEQGGR